MKFFKEIGLTKGIKNLNKWIKDYKPVLELIRQEAKKEQAQEILDEFNKLWSCLKFEKMKSKVVGYTFVKKDMDKFKLHLSTLQKEVKKCSHPYYHYDKEGIRRCTVCNEKVKLKGYYEIGFESKIFKVPKEFLNKYKEEVIQHTKDKVFDDMEKLWKKCQNHSLRKFILNDIKELKKKHLENQKKSE